MNNLYQMADNDPVKIEQFKKIPLVEYWTILDNRIEQYLKEKSKTK